MNTKKKEETDSRAVEWLNGIGETSLGDAGSDAKRAHATRHNRACSACRLLLTRATTHMLRARHTHAHKRTKKNSQIYYAKTDTTLKSERTERVCCTVTQRLYTHIAYEGALSVCIGWHACIHKYLHLLPFPPPPPCRRLSSTHRCTSYPICVISYEIYLMAAVLHKLHTPVTCLQSVVCLLQLCAVLVVVGVVVVAGPADQSRRRRRRHLYPAHCGALWIFFLSRPLRNLPSIVVYV